MSSEPRRFPIFETTPKAQWEDWRWQQRNRFTSRSNLRDFFPKATESLRKAFEGYVAQFHLALTPYTLSLIALDELGLPVEDDPIWAQFRFCENSEYSDYAEHRENWERPSEMPTPILQHKYPDRAIFRLVNTCFGHCNYCYLTARVLDRQAEPARRGGHQAWADSLDYLHQHPEIQDVLLSGGDPLMLDNDKLGAVLHDLAKLPSIRSIRINTRACTFNPFRFDPGLAELFRKYRVTALEVHIAHPRELTPELDAGLAYFDQGGHRPLILWRAPLLRGVNDQEEVLVELFRGLYARRITPYYLFHYAPFTLGRAHLGLPVRRGVELMQRIRRRVPGPAFPRYTLFHIDGKQDIPLELEGTPDFRYERDLQDKAWITFRNWKGDWVSYPDLNDHA